MYLKIKNDCKLIEKKRLTEFTFFLKYTFIKNFEWKPGQYVGITTTPAYRRSYSIVDYDGDNLSFLIDIRPGGPASQYFEKVEIGATNQILGPYGTFTLKDTLSDKVFISTGTGIAPFVPMIKHLKTSKTRSRVKIFSGARLQNEDIAFQYIESYLGDSIQYHQCITREQPSEKDFRVITHFGRVTNIISQQNLDWQNTEFYICGGPEMVSDIENMLKDRGANKIYIEKY